MPLVIGVKGQQERERQFALDVGAQEAGALRGRQQLRGAREAREFGLAGQIRVLREQTKQALITGKFNTNEQIRLQKVKTRLDLSLRQYDRNTTLNRDEALHWLKRDMEDLQHENRLDLQEQQAEDRAEAATLEATQRREEATSAAIIAQQRFLGIEARKTREAELTAEDRRLRLRLGEERLGLEERRVEVLERPPVVGLTPREKAELKVEFKRKAITREKEEEQRQARNLLTRGLPGLIFKGEDGKDKISFKTYYNLIERTKVLSEAELNLAFGNWFIRLSHSEKQVVRNELPNLPGIPR